jgi:hypothetical protein
MSKVYESWKDAEEEIATAMNNRDRRIKRLLRNCKVMASIVMAATGMTENELRNKVQQMGGYGEEI